MCRNIKPLFNYYPPATDGEVYSSSLQYVRKISGFRKPSRINEAAFENAVKEIAIITGQLIESLETTSPARNREIEAARAKAKAQARFARSS
ncbi:MAG: DUF2277 domain-containing protein [Chloroflexi bacterium]|nr:DUF2277 domain-containing protein [Chloroflexota bacterium]MDK1045975.1 DUF2277 domain-containing protein [Anaerolineales bacterium]MCH8341747.1 DUF2277 domain-containing protein [Chloroflexota bacterium]MCH8876747.1 DUF2277 domain-containing protein [Chloroflexota bacterium]MCI0862432.1 DUF2277 domain-containing protein [Chloroflexota bacterium]